MRRLHIRAESTGWILLLLLAYFGMAVHMAAQLPPLATPNELLNFEYVQVMRQIEGLPNRGLVDSEVRPTEWHQPPLYFAFAAIAGLPVPVPEAEGNPPPPIEWPSNPAYLATHRGNLNPVVHITPQNTPLLYTSRIAATLLGMLGIAALYRAGRTVYGTAVALLMASLLAFQPNYLHLSGSVNNDMPLTAVSAMVLAYTVLLIHGQKPPRAYFGLGLLAAAAVLTKANGVFVLAYLGLAWLLVWWQSRAWGPTIKSALYTLAGLLPLWGAWLVLNTVRMNDTLGVSGSLPVDRVLALRPADFLLLLPWLDDMWRSFWLDWSAGDVGYGPDWFYLLWAFLLGLGLLGWLRSRLNHNQWPLTAAVLIGVAAISYLYLAVKALTVKEAGYLVPEGRWWLPVMPGLAWLAAVGYSYWWPPARRQRALLLSAGLPAISALLLLAFHLPALYPQAQPLPPVATNTSRQSLIYDDVLALEAATGPATLPGASGAVTLTWHALADIDQDYTVAAQLLVPSTNGWHKLDEQYSYPGLGQNPTAGWQAGQRFRDTIWFESSQPLDGPTLAQVSVQVQDRHGNLPASQQGTAVDPPLVLASVARPVEMPVVAQPLTDDITFGAAIALRGAAVTPSDGDLLVTLWWEALGQPGQDYTIFVHALTADGDLLGQNDNQPLGGASPTSIWREGDIIRDTHRLPQAAQATAVRVGLYEASSGTRLAANLNEQPLPDNYLTLPLEP